MILFFGNPQKKVYAVDTSSELSPADIEKLKWLFGNAPQLETSVVDGIFVGPRSTMVSPWSTNAVEITQNMSINGIGRIEEYTAKTGYSAEFDPMLSEEFEGLDQEIFVVDLRPEGIVTIEDIEAYNQKEGLSLSENEVYYLHGLSKKLGRPLTDSEVFGFSQVNSEHCRHKIFNGRFIIDGQEKPASLFQLIKKTSLAHPNDIVSAYKDNVAFLKGPTVEQFAPKCADIPDFYQNKEFDSVISLKAETHNFPTTVEPFYGAATGSGGEIRDRLAGGKGALPLAGTAVYMTAYSRLKRAVEMLWEKQMEERPWLYQTPLEILIKASNGASDFGNKFGQPLICGSVLTFEHEENGRKLGYDKTIMQAGGVGYGKADQALKDKPTKGDQIVVLGGENYRIGMGGASVSSVDTGETEQRLELNAVQRANPEMQKRAANAIRGMVESPHNPIISVHDHGAGGHLNCLSELVEDTGGVIEMDKLPIGDPTLSDKEIIGNESQERMGLLIAKENLEVLKAVADRERSPLYIVGEVTCDNRFKFQKKDEMSPIDLELEDMFGKTPQTVMRDQTMKHTYEAIAYQESKVFDYLHQVLRLEAVASKDWLTNKVDRCVSGRVAKQQTVGALQLPLNNCGVVALDYKGKEGVATSLGHAPVSALIDPVAGSRNSLCEALTNIVWAPLKNGLKSVSLSANWMWPANNPGEDARLYQAVQGLSDFAISLGINIPTGKDSLSMKQRYQDDEVLAPGTVIISAAGHCDNIQQVVEPVLQTEGESLYYLNFSQDQFKLGGSSFGQVLNKIGKETPTIQDEKFVVRAFNTVQNLIRKDLVLAGHDVSSGGLITTLLELCFATPNVAATIDLTGLGEEDTIKLLFSENAGIVFQAKQDKAVEALLNKAEVAYVKIGEVVSGAQMQLKNGKSALAFNIPELRDIWYETSYLLDQKQSGVLKAKERFENYKEQPLQYVFPAGFTGKVEQVNGPKIKAAILREKGSNSEREMARAMHLAGFEVKDIHMTDLISGREDLKDIQFIAAVGGFSNSDVLGSAKGWAGAFLYNEKANQALKNFFSREDVLSLGVCNGCQLFIELGLINPDHAEKPKMLFNDSGKFECVFTSVEIPENDTVMLHSLAGSTLGIWAAHGEGKFNFPYAEEEYNIVGRYGYTDYPANPNGSAYNAAFLCDDSGRHLVTMPHLERSTFPWNWAYYPKGRADEVTPWLEAFVNARKWLEKRSR